MSATAAFPRRSTVTASELCGHLSLTPEARAALKTGMSCREFLTALLARRLHASALDFVAHALPAREAIWWGCLCLQHSSGGALQPSEKAAFKAAVEWVIRPGESTRLAAKEPAEIAGSRSAGGALARAAHQTGGSLGPANCAPIPPPPYLPAKTVAMAVKFISLRGDPRQMSERQRCYVELGIEMMQTARVI